jgi:hypothetical protein
LHNFAKKIQILTITTITKKKRFLARLRSKSSHLGCREELPSLMPFLPSFSSTLSSSSSSQSSSQIGAPEAINDRASAQQAKSK